MFVKLGKSFPDTVSLQLQTRKIQSGSKQTQDEPLVEDDFDSKSDSLSTRLTRNFH